MSLVARTMADLASEDVVSFAHVSEALSLRAGPRRRGAMTGDGLPEEAYAVALASMPSVGPATLHGLLAGERPSEAWARARSVTGASERLVARAWERHAALGIGVLMPGGPSWPVPARRRPPGAGAPLLPGPSRRPRRGPHGGDRGHPRPTRYGIGVAAQLGADLSGAGVSVVSGLALGIDGAAHEGACGVGAPPIGVVAGGLDDPYPRRHARLWERVAERGVIVSESPAGVRTEKWRFPVRNRLLASLSDVVVVVESRHHGGVAPHGRRRGGPRHPGRVPCRAPSAAPTSEGTNALLADGAFPVCSTGDILVALSLEGMTVEVPRPAGASRPAEGPDRSVYEVLSPDPAPLNELVRLSGLPLAALCGALERLAQAGLARDVGGWWHRT